MNIEKRVLDKKRHGELVSAIDNVEKKITSEVTVRNPVESVSVENLDELKSVEVSNFPKQKEYPKSVDVKKPKWFSMKGIEDVVETGMVEVIKLLQKIVGKKIDLDEYKKANNALATRLVTRDGRDFYNAIMSGGSDNIGSGVYKNFAGGDEAIGTTVAEIVFTEDTNAIMITADIYNTGILYIGGSGVQSDGTNAITFLQQGESVSMSYQDKDNPLYIIANTVDQKYYKVSLLWA